jgi:hypothetical protein
MILEYCSTKIVKNVKLPCVGFKKSNLGFRASVTVNFCKKCFDWFLATNMAVSLIVSISSAEMSAVGLTPKWN